MARVADPAAAGPSERGFTVIELLIVVAILGMLAMIAIPVYGESLQKSRRAALAEDMAVLHEAFLRYYADHGKFPAEADFARDTMNPLTSGGYFRADSLRGKLLDRQAILYVAPDINAIDSDFILVARSIHEPNLWVYALSYDWGVGRGYEGVYFWVDGQFVQVN